LKYPHYFALPALFFNIICYVCKRNVEWISGEVYLVKQRSLQQGGHSVSHTFQPGRENTASGLVWGTESIFSQCSPALCAFPAPVLLSGSRLQLIQFSLPSSLFLFPHFPSSGISFNTSLEKNCIFKRPFMTGRVPQVVDHLLSSMRPQIQTPVLY
jgi:hypothetical protein